jgi:hypothetical protein
VRDADIAARLQQAGLRVVEVAGWRTRGEPTLDARGSVNHHTAGTSNGTIPSLQTLINGKSGVPGPLCNVAQSREADGNDIFYVIAAGKANHAGLGGWKGLTGNSSVYGLEIEHTGTVPLSEQRQRLAARCHAALIRGRATPAMVCQHFEWAPTRKIDAAQGVNGDQFRQYVSEALDPQTAGPSLSLLEVGMYIAFGPKGAALVGPGYWCNLDSEGYDRMRAIPGMQVVSVDQRGWDVMHAVATHGQSADDPTT